MAIEDELIDSEAADLLIQWEVFVALEIGIAVDNAVENFGSTAEALRQAETVVIQTIGPVLARAFNVGVGIASSAWRLITGRRVRTPRIRPRRPQRPGEPPISNYPARVQQQILNGVQAIEGGAEPQPVIDQTKARLQSVGTSTVNEGAAAGSQRFADQVQAPGVMWVAERNACLTCTALAGEVSRTGRFDSSITYADKPPDWGLGSQIRPPRHPNCRCRLVPWDGTPDIPNTMKREAQRSVIRGWSLPSESEVERLRAAERLLAQGTVLPKSVVARAREDVLAGEFRLGRDLPDPDSI